MDGPTQPEALEHVQKAFEVLESANDLRRILLAAIIDLWDFNAGLVVADNVWHIQDIDRWRIAALVMRSASTPSGDPEEAAIDRATKDYINRVAEIEAEHAG